MLAQAHPNIQVVFTAEGDKHKIQMLEAMHTLYSTSPNHIRPRHYTDIKDRDNATAPPCDLFVSGAPCPAGSSAGPRLGLDNKPNRGVLILHSLNYVQKHRPRVVIFENVKGLTFKQHAGILASLRGILDRAGYSVRMKIMNTKDHGIPHSRPRLYIVAVLSECEVKRFKFPRALGERPALKRCLSNSKGNLRASLKPGSVICKNIDHFITTHGI